MRNASVLVAMALVAGSACVTVQSAGSAPLTPREEAQRLLARGDGAAALKLLEPLATAAPRDLDLARAVAEAHVKAGSAEAFLSALQGHDSAVGHYQAGLVRFARAAHASGPAIVEFRRAVELAPDEPELRYRLGLALLESEQDELARPELEAAFQASPRPAWLLPLAKVRHRTGDDARAVEALRALVTAPATPAEISVARELMEQIADPFVHLPKAARAQLDQAMQSLQVGDVPQQAIDQLEVLLAEHPDEAVLHALLGLCWARLDDAGRAIEELKRAIELDPADGKNHLYLAEIYESRQRASIAEEHLRLAVERNPLLDAAWLRLGDVALERQDHAAAKQDFEVAARLAPESPAAHGKLALVLQLQGDWPSADRELHVVLDREPENLEFMLRLGVLHAERFTKARTPEERKLASAEASRWLTKVLEAQPENALASRALERISAH